MRKVRFLCVILALVLATGVALAQPFKVDLHPIADDMPGIRGAVSIECNTITGTIYTISLSNLPENTFTLILSAPAREDFVVGDVAVTTRDSETVAVFRSLTPCPRGVYQTVKVMNGTRLIMFGNLPL